MLKSTLFTFISLLCATFLYGQSEPEKSAAPLASSTPPPNVHDAGKPPTQASPPPAGAPAEAATGESAKPPVEKNPPALDPNNFDTSVKPGDDFYSYANGGWLKRNPIPPDQSRWGSFNALIEKTNDDLHDVAEKAARAATESKVDPDTQKVADYYGSGMDEAAVNEAKATPLADEMKRIDAVKDRQGVLAEIAHLHALGVTSLFGFTSGQDEKNSTMVISQAYQDGLGLPDRDYYTKTDDASKKIRDQYVDHVSKMLTLAGQDAEKAKAAAGKILAMETDLAKASRTRVELRDPQKNYNKMKVEGLQKLMPDFKLADYFKELKLSDPGAINVGQPDFFKGANKVFVSTPVEDWKNYFRWHLVHATAAELSQDFVDENFNFFLKTLTGAEQLKTRWKRVVSSTDASLGEALGKLYVADYFPPESKTRMVELVKNVQDAMADAIKNCSWMDEQTKKEALKKLAAFTVKIGYPDKWRDYSMLKVDRGSYAMNAMRASMFEVDRELKKIGKPVDRSEWNMTPPTINAQYQPTLNQISFPAGILQPPFFNAAADDATNYGGIGAVIAHEITHGFDDQGRQYDAQGNLRDWWTPASAAKYKERAAKIVKQYSEYEPLPGLHINGELTQGENIADDGGVKIAFAAMKKALAGKPQEKIDGFTPEQRFFFGWAQVWRANIRDEALKMRLVTDPHSPTKYRCNGPVSNSADFQKAFGLPDGCPMVRPADKRVSIW
ncbi:MAG: M13 family metallopeptidase [Verrucomicrobiota bacterium]